MGFLFSRKKKLILQPEFTAVLAPEGPFCVIGDIHGSLAKLRALLARLPQDVASAPLICVGDYVDRGDDSAGVIDLLRSLQAERPGQVICLMGNHERMLLDFLQAPDRAGPRWMRYGGRQTLASYGLGQPGGSMTPAQWEALAETFRARLGAQTEAWLTNLPLTWQSGNVAVIHAAADPALPIEAQPEDAALWGHADFTSMPRADGVWVVHGHTIVPKPIAESGRIAVDTGAFATGRLSAAIIRPDALEFVSV